MVEAANPVREQIVSVWRTEGATDYLRGDVVIEGGITGLVKIAHPAEASA